MTLDLPDGLSAEFSRWAKTPEEDLGILRDIGDITTHGHTGHCVIVSDDGREVARVEYYYFPMEPAGFIGWMQVDEDYRRQGIGSAIRKAAVDDLFSMGAEAVYTGPLSSVAESIARDQGFQPVESGGLADEFPGKYLVRRP